MQNFVKLSAAVPELSAVY